MKVINFAFWLPVLVALTSGALVGQSVVQQFNPSTSGALLTINGTVTLSTGATVNVNASISDKDIHSGAIQTVPTSATAAASTCTAADQVATDAYLLQSGAPTGCDPGDSYEGNNLSNHDGQASLSDPAADYMFNIVTHYQCGPNHGACNFGTTMTNTNGTVTSGDTGFLTITNNGPVNSYFVGTITLEGTPGPNAAAVAGCTAGQNLRDSLTFTTDSPFRASVQGAPSGLVTLPQSKILALAFDTSGCGGFSSSQTVKAGSLSAGNTTTAAFDNTQGQELIHTIKLPTSGFCPQGGVSNPQLLSTNMIVSNNGGVQSYTHKTPFATGVLFEQEADDQAENGSGYGSFVVDKCYAQGADPSTASFLSCPVANPQDPLNPLPSELINLTMLFDFPSSTANPNQEPSIAPGTTVSQLHHPGQRYVPSDSTDCTTNSFPPTVDWEPVPSGAAVNPVCTEVQTGAAYLCDLEDSLLYDPGIAFTSNPPVWGVFGDQTGTGSGLKSRGVVTTLYNIPMLTTQVSVNGKKVNNPGVPDTSGVHWFKTSSLSLDFVVNPACTAANSTLAGCTNVNQNGWFAAPVNNLAYVFYNSNSTTEPLLPNAQDGTCRGFPAANCTLAAGSAQPGLFITNTTTAPQVEFTDTTASNPDGIYILGVSAKDTVRNGERYIQLITDPNVPCPNPNNEIPTTPAGSSLSHPCYSTDLFKEQIGIDTVKPTVTFVAPFTAVLNTTSSATLAVNFSCQDNPGGSGIASCTGSVPTGTTYPVNTPLPPTNVSVTATDNATNTATQSQAYSIGYEPAGTICDGDAGHQILQPINNYPSQVLSVFKQGRTVPVKFRVCDANGVSIGTPGTITSNPFTCTATGSTSLAVDEAVTSTTPDTTFRFDTTAQQWIFNLGTSNWPGGGTKFSCTITLNDGSTIPFTFALR